MRRRPAPLLSGDDDRGAARGQRAPPVEPAMVPERARARADAGRAADGLPVHSLTTPLAGPGTLTPNGVTPPGGSDHALPLPAPPTRTRRRAFEPLTVDPAGDVAM